MALLALRMVGRPADDEYTFGYSKIEYFASGFEGGIILLPFVNVKKAIEDARKAPAA